MKTLYSKLGSLLPSHNSKEVLALPDQIDEAVNYIKSLQTKLEKSKEKKETLTKRKRDDACIASTTGIMCRKKSPQIEIHEMGPNLDIVLINGLENPFSFYEIIRVLYEEGAEVLHANFSTSGNSIFHILHGKIGDPTRLMSFEANNTISKRLNDLIRGSSSSSFDAESPLDIWDFDFN